VEKTRSPAVIASRTLATIAVAIGLIAPSHAGTILQTIGWANGYEQVDVVGTAQPVADNGPAGGFDGIWNGTDILFFCDDLGHYFSLGSTYTDDYVATPLTGTFADNLSRLYTEAYSTGTPVDTTTESVAFQLAIWELEYETVAGPYDLTTGTFTATADPATIAEANALLSGLGNFAPLYQITQLSSTLPNAWGQAHSQDFIFATTTLRDTAPEPATLGLLAAGLAGLGFMRRRRAN